MAGCISVLIYEDTTDTSQVNTVTSCDGISSYSGIELSLLYLETQVLVIVKWVISWNYLEAEGVREGDPLW